MQLLLVACKEYTEFFPVVKKKNGSLRPDPAAPLLMETLVGGKR
jgi:hypothetical protein